MSDQIGILQVLSGSHIPALKRIKLYSSDEWEEFIEEWLSIKKEEYIEVERLGGAGDKGRDVIGIISKSNDKSYSWDNYQAKHYDHPLTPTDIWTEIGKLCYYTYLNEYPIPRHYFFVAPQGIGTSLSDLIRKSENLRAGLISNWEKYCKNKITKAESVKLESKFLEYVNNFDFSIFDKVTPLTLIEEHSKTKYHIPRFGGNLPARPKPKSAPEKIQDHELGYIQKLLIAYNSDSDLFYVSVESLNKSKYIGHLKRSREYFHQAEQLRSFSRDTLPSGIFSAFKDEIFSGTVDITEEEHESGFKCVKSVEKEARKLAITSNPLNLCSDGNDRVGVCHHLANENKLSWQDENEE